MPVKKMITPLLALVACSVLLSGCSAGFRASSAAPSSAHLELQGTIHGGQQPISGASVALYAGSINGYGSAVQSILQAPVTTTSTGAFNITGDYSCTTGQQMYLVATGGNTGSGVNPNSAIMAALGDCAQLSANTYVNANEVTTVASAFALAPFMSGASALGTSSTNIAGLARAFASVHKLVNTATGAAPGDLLPAGATAPTAEINTLANLIAACVNTTGDAGSLSLCHQLFVNVTPAGGIVPTDTVGAALAIAKNPTLNVPALFNMIPASNPFQPSLTTAPIDWTLAIDYAGSFNKPTTTAIDQSGNIWVANAGNNTVTALAQTGSPATTAPLSGNGLAAPTAAAIDAAGNAWFANATGAVLSAFTPSGTALTGSPFTSNGISQPVSLAFDAIGNVWVANAGNDSILELTSSGVPVQQISTTAASSSIAINPK
ncbi:hypothetical protein SAMN05421770_103389 [Granulicella rosea]|uniref:Streptogramin lyase n=1 Tax=Granulicella rosea TaxID=474952 RepID=A0A239J298_9BACT|nr:hypothetical protein [Granulicella rosea]SNS99588.1 hypothetical protein SAMN05421770_103389 [Granulicella rosea]